MVDVSSGLMLLILPTTNKFIGTKFSFTFQVTGSEYNFFEKLVLGPNGKTFMIIGVVMAAVIFIIIFGLIIYGIVKCCRKSKN